VNWIPHLAVAVLRYLLKPDPKRVVLVSDRNQTES
jgi:hypothetical protein